MLRRDAAGRADAVHARRGAGHRGRRPCALGRLAPALRGTSPTQAQARDRRRRGERPRRDPRSPSAPSRRHRAARRRPEQAPPGARAALAADPAAGNGAGQRLAARIARTLRDAGLRVEIERTPAQGEGARLAREAAEAGYGMVIAVGGDGTANEIANGLVGSGTALALYPIGAGNDFARALGYPRRRRDVPRFIRTARRRTIDVGDANGRVFLNAA